VKKKNSSVWIKQEMRTETGKTVATAWHILGLWNEERDQGYL
jgi:hypothetical protein